MSRINTCEEKFLLAPPTVNTYTQRKAMSRRVPDVIFKTRVRDESVGGDNPFRWQDMTTDDYFAGKRVVVFSLPGAFTPICSTMQLPTYEKMAEDFKGKGIDEVYCMSVNDGYVMNAWAKDQGLKHVKVIPDGSGHFTRGMGMLVQKDPEGFGLRSWRYAMVVNDKVVEEIFVEDGQVDNCSTDPYVESHPEKVLAYLDEGEEKVYKSLSDVYADAKK